MWRKAFVVAAVLAAASCASSERRVDGVIQLGIERLGSDASSRSGSHEFRTAVNVTGVSLPYSVGSIVTNPGGNLPELLAYPQSYGCSKIVETIYQSTAGAGDVAGVGRAIDRIASALAAQTSVNLRLSVLAAAAQRADEIRAGQSDATAAAAAVESNRAVAAARRSLNMENLTPDAVAAKRAELNTQLAAARQLQADAATELQTLRAIPNLVVFRWSGSEEQRAGFNLGAILGFDSRSSQDRTGYIVMADVRTAALVPGADFVWATEFARRHGDFVERAFGSRYVTTFTLGARHIAFAEDRNWAQLLRTELNLSPAEVRLLLGGDIGQLLGEQSVQIEAALSVILSASSQGLISAPARSVYDFRMTSVEARQLSAAAEAQRGEGYSVVYSNRSTIEEAARSTSGAARPSRAYIRSPIVWRCMHAIAVLPNNGAATVTPRLTISLDHSAPSGPNDAQESSSTTSAGRAPTTVTNSRGEVVLPINFAVSRVHFCRPEYGLYYQDPFGLDPRAAPSSGEQQELGWQMRRPAPSLSDSCIDLVTPDDPATVDTK